MDNYENNNNNEYTNSSEETNQPQKYDPVGEFKTKIIFLVVIVAIMIAVKFIFGF